MRPTSRLLAASLAVAVASPSFAFAQSKVDKKACTAAYEQTQKLRKSGKLVDAKKSALACAQEGCPTFVRDECTSWTVDIEKSMPTIVVAVVDDAGNDVTDVTVKLDGEAISATGGAVALDPGTHKVSVKRGDEDAIEQDVVAHEGEKNRRITVKLPSKSAGKPDDDKATTQPEKTETATDLPPEPVAASRPVPATVWVFGAIGLVGVAGFATFGAMGMSKKSDLDAQGCKPNCAQSDVDAAKQKFLLADVSLGVAVVGLGLATVLFLSRGTETPKAVGKVPAVDVAAGPRGAAATLKWTF